MPQKRVFYVAAVDGQILSLTQRRKDTYRYGGRDFNVMEFSPWTWMPIMQTLKPRSIAG